MKSLIYLNNIKYRLRLFIELKRLYETWLPQTDRLQFIRNVIQKDLRFSPPQVDYFFALPGKGTFVVIFTSYTLFEQWLECYNQKKDNNPRLQKVLLIPLSERESKAVTFIIYSEKVTTENIFTWLSFHFSVSRSMELRDEDGIRTEARVFYVQLMRDRDSGLLQHLPSTIQLGPIRGHVFYAGQPKTVFCNCVAPRPTLQQTVKPPSAKTARGLTILQKTATNQRHAIFVVQTIPLSEFALNCMPTELGGLMPILSFHQERDFLILRSRPAAARTFGQEPPRTIWQGKSTGSNPSRGSNWVWRQGDYYTNLRWGLSKRAVLRYRPFNATGPWEWGAGELESPSYNTKWQYSVLPVSHLQNTRSVNSRFQGGPTSWPTSGDYYIEGSCFIQRL